MELKGKTALVTGASRGIGKEVSIELAKAECNLIIVGRDVNNLGDTKSEIEKTGGVCKVICADFTSEDSVKSLLAEIKLSKSIDILCNIAGVWHSEDKPYFDIEYVDFTDEAITDSLNVGIKASMLLTKAVIPLMKGEGRIINTSGTFGQGERKGVWEKGCMADLVTKKAIEVFTKQLSFELEKTKITVNAVRPWYVWTENVQKFYPEVESEAIPVKTVAKVYLDILKSDKKGEVVEIRK